jgi:hypothetical protein
MHCTTYRSCGVQAKVHLIALALTFHHTLSDREGYVIDLYAELVEKDMQIEHMGTQIHQLQEEVQ